MKERISKFTARFRYALLGSALVVAGSSVAFSHLAGDQPMPPARVVVDTEPLTRHGDLVTSFSPIVKQVAPAVVNVFTTATVKQVAQEGTLPLDDPFLRRFFGDRFNFDRDQLEERFRAPRQNGLGSGVVISEDGYILTNNHVVEQADEIRVAMTDGREYTAQLVGRDPKTDVAVLKIAADEALPFATLGDSDKVEVGDVVLAIGNPFGVGQTVTMGMVSAKGRANVGLDYEDFIQTDAAINPGNSGGALVDARGRLIGMNTAILSRSGGNQGIGFAVPINLAHSVMTDLLDDGQVQRGYLGVRIQTLDRELAKAFGLEDSLGALVAEVSPDSPAEKAGLQEGDVILAYDGKKIRDSRHLQFQVAETDPGAKVVMTVRRDGKDKELTVVPEELPVDGLVQSGTEAVEKDQGGLKGVAVADIDSQARRELSLAKGLKGALVTQVDPSSAAHEAGLRRGDVILEINRQPVQSASEAVELARDVEDSAVLVRVWSRNGTRYLVIDETR